MTAMSCTTCLRTALVRRQQYLVAARRSFTTAPLLRSASASQPSSSPPPSSPSPSPPPPLSTPTSAPGEPPKQPAAPLSVCPEGTILTGLNYFKSGTDPVALKDEEYPEWLWRCLEMTKKAEGEDVVLDEFSSSKKQRRLAAKKQQAREAELIAAGNLEALQPKVPLQQQSINILGEEGGTVTDNLAAAAKRQELKNSMRRERRAKIKESNYLKTM